MQSVLRPSYIGMDFGGTKLLLGEMDPEGKFLRTRRVPTGPMDQESACRLMEDALQAFLVEPTTGFSPCAVGIGLMTLNEKMQFNIGDLFCLGCAVANAAMAVIDETAVAQEDVDAFQLGWLSLGVCGLLCTVTAFLAESPHLPASAATAGCTVFLMIFCTGLPFIVQPIAQQYTSAVHVGVIFTMEPVFASIVAFALAGERLLPRGYVGAVILLFAMLWMEIDLRSLLSGRKKDELDVHR